MPLNLASPGIVVREVDLTVGRVDPTSNQIGAIVAPFAQGPIDVPTLVERQELVQGYRVLVFDTGVGTGLTTLVGSATSVGIGTTNVIGVSTDKLDNIYEAYYTQFSGTVGILTCQVDPDTNFVGIATTGSYLEPAGRISWGRISSVTRNDNPISVSVDGNAFEVGMTTYPTFQRRNGGLRNTGALSKQ